MSEAFVQSCNGAADYAIGRYYGSDLYVPSPCSAERLTVKGDLWFLAGEIDLGDVYLDCE
jgi:hypothetical protein